MRLNIFLVFLILIIISFVITLNVFFQQNYQQEMAEQFNRQQLIIARAVSSSIQSSFNHIEKELQSFTRLLSRRGLDRTGLREFVSDSFAEEEIEEGVQLKLFDSKGDRLYPAEGPSERGAEFARIAARLRAGETFYRDSIVHDRNVKLITPVLQKGKMAATVVVEVSIDAVNKKYLEPIKSGERGYAWMMDGSGTLIYHPTQENMVGKNIYNADASCFECHSSFKTEAMILAAPDIGFSSYVSPRGEDKLLSFSRFSISDMSWIVCVSIPFSEVTTSIQKSMRLHSMLIISIFGMTVIGAFIIISINRSRTKAEEKARHLERQRALEHEVIHAKDYLENILESTQTGIMVIGTDHVVTTVNSAYEKLFDRPKGEVLNRNIFDIIPFSHDREIFHTMIQHCLGGNINNIRDYPVRVGGSEKKINIVMSPLNIHNAVAGVILSGSDVTEEANLKEKIREYAHELEEIVRERTKELSIEKEKLNAIVDSIEAGICIFGSDKRLIWINRVMKDWLSEEKRADLKLDDIYGGKHTFDSLKHAVVDNRFIQEVVYNDFGNKKGYFQVVSTPLVSPEGKSDILVLVQDLTEIKMAEEQMMQSEKLSALARLSAGVSHEIGNPLTSISSYVQILKDMDFDDFTREALETISRHINRIATIVRQMSSFTKAKQEQIEPLSVKEIIDATLQLVKYDKRTKNIKISEDIASDVPKVKAGSDQLEQVFINIVLNAADAMPDGGELTIRAFRNHNTVDIEFRDTGKGIAREHLEKIFDPFFTTKEKGTGLGLSVSYTIVRSFGGAILVSSTPGEGSVFTVRLPAYEG
ncbi:MAG: ATP-binding protein [bacterium]